jgi:hypothetical protein
MPDPWLCAKFGLRRAMPNGTMHLNGRQLCQQAMLPSESDAALLCRIAYRIQVGQCRRCHYNNVPTPRQWGPGGFVTPTAPTRQGEKNKRTDEEKKEDLMQVKLPNARTHARQCKTMDRSASLMLHPLLHLRYSNIWTCRQAEGLQGTCVVDATCFASFGRWCRVMHLHSDKPTNGQHGVSSIFESSQ